MNRHRDRVEELLEEVSALFGNLFSPPALGYITYKGNVCASVSKLDGTYSELDRQLGTIGAQNDGLIYGRHGKSATAVLPAFLILLLYAGRKELMNRSSDKVVNILSAKHFCKSLICIQANPVASHGYGDRCLFDECPELQIMLSPLFFCTLAFGDVCEECHCRWAVRELGPRVLHENRELRAVPAEALGFVGVRHREALNAALNVLQDPGSPFRREQFDCWAGP